MKLLKGRKNTSTFITPVLIGAVFKFQQGIILGATHDVLSSACIKSTSLLSEELLCSHNAKHLSDPVISFPLYSVTVLTDLGISYAEKNLVILFKWTSSLILNGMELTFYDVKLVCLLNFL